MHSELATERAHEADDDRRLKRPRKGIVVLDAVQGARRAIVCAMSDAASMRARCAFRMRFLSEACTR
jgi:hypothetical protein